MILAVTLLRDELSNVRRFVAENLRGGVDHLLVFLDGEQPEVAAWLGDQAQVSVVVCDAAWWGADRLESLNGRQRVAANLALAVCAEVGYVEWLCFVDGDEVAVIDRDVLAAVPPDVAVVRLQPLEAVSQAGGDVLFKRLLDRRGLRRLKRRGLLERANNARYFRGHVSGKVGVRPGARLWFGVHTAVDEAGDKVPAYEHPALRHLHYESPTLPEFVRKWTALAASGPAPGMRDRRAAVLEAFTALAAEPDPALRRAEHERLYVEAAAEDVTGLSAAGVLVGLDEVELVQTPRPLAPGQRARLDEALSRAADAPKRSFLHPRHRDGL